MYCWINNRTFLFRKIIRCALLSGLILTLFSACSGDKQKTSPLYPVDSLLRSQVRFLTVNQASITKTSKLDDKDHTTTVKPKDSVAWKKELEIFEVLELINKPVNKNLYKSEDLLDIRSNLKVRSYSTTEKLPIRYVRLYYYRSIEKIRKIEAEYHESNPLYRSARNLSMEFDEINGRPILISYQIIGGQKMFLDDSVQYNIKGYITLRH